MNTNPWELVYRTKNGIAFVIRPDENGDLPSGEKSYEWAYSILGDEPEVIGDWITRAEAIEGAIVDGEQYDSEIASGFIPIGTRGSWLHRYVNTETVTRRFEAAGGVWVDVQTGETLASVRG